MTGYNFPSRVQLQADVECMHSKPSEGGQHEVVHESRYDHTASRVVQLSYVVVDQKSEVEQEGGQHQVDQDLCGFTGLGFPVESHVRGFMSGQLNNNSILYGP